MEGLKAAIQEAYASVPAAQVILETIELSHPSLPDGTLYMVQAREDITATLETAESVTFKAVPFRFTLPASGRNGRQELRLSIDNIDRAVSDFVEAVMAYNSPVSVVYRPYLADDLTAPQMDPPLRLTLSEISMNLVEASGRASFADILNRKFPYELYTRERFPSLGG